MKKYDSIDLVKFIAAIFIVLMHADLFFDIYETCPYPYEFFCHGIARLGVPFFFVSTAFFYFRKPLTWDGTKKYCKRLLILYAAWFVIYLPKTIFDRIITSPYSLGESIFRLVRAFFVTSTFSGSWFIVSCVFCALLYYLISKLNKKTVTIVTIVISIVSYVWFTFTSAYGALMGDIGIKELYDKYELIFAKPYMSFLVGIPYFAVGKYFAEVYRGEHRYNYSKNRSIVLSFLPFVLLMIEVYCCYKYNLRQSTDCYIMLLPCICAVFPLILNWNIELKNAKYLRISSTIIFFSQFYFLFAVEAAEKVFNTAIPYYIKSAFTLVMVLLTSWLVIMLQDKKGFHWLKYLY